MHLPYGGPSKHRERIARQSRDEVVYLIAWLDDRPVGHALLKWSGSADVLEPSHLVEPCPDIEDLLVEEELRNQGIGSRLLQEAEDIVRAKGIRRVGLGADVAPDNPARRLYERLGYRDAGYGSYLLEGEYVDQDGQLQHWQEMCDYLIKDLCD